MRHSGDRNLNEIKPPGIYKGTYGFFNPTANKSIITGRKKGEIINAEVCI